MFNQKMVYSALIALSLSSAAFAQDATTTATPEGQSSVPATEAKKEAKRKFQAEIYNRYDVPAANANHGEANVTSVNYLGLKYNIDNDRNVSLRQTFTVKPRFKETEEKSAMGDTYLAYAQNNLAKWGADGHLDLISARLYVPTSYDSRVVNTQNIRALTWIAATGKLTPAVDITYYNVNDARQYSNEYDAKGSPRLTAETSNSIGFAFDVAPKFNLEINPGITNDFMTNGVSTAELNNDYYLTYSGLKPVTLLVSVHDTIDIKTPSQPFRLFREENLMYRFYIVATL